ncbi:hypothetical protein Mapa_017088 [Marchantia paleacea]|nr:hypothetical protein Mapa_017088 [Marchantia paleacea]
MLTVQVRGGRRGSISRGRGMRSARIDAALISWHQVRKPLQPFAPISSSRAVRSFHQLLQSHSLLQVLVGSWESAGDAGEEWGCPRAAAMTAPLLSLRSRTEAVRSRRARLERGATGAPVHQLRARHIRPLESNSPAIRA